MTDDDAHSNAANNIDLAACQRLWVSVFATAVKDATRTRELKCPHDADMQDLHKRAADAWVGTRDFHTVVTLAGMDPDAVRERWPNIDATELHRAGSGRWE